MTIKLSVDSKVFNEGTYYNRQHNESRLKETDYHHSERKSVALHKVLSH